MAGTVIKSGSGTAVDAVVVYDSTLFNMVAFAIAFGDFGIYQLFNHVFDDQGVVLRSGMPDDEVS